MRRVERVKILYSGILALQNQESTGSNLMGVGQQNGKSEEKNASSSEVSANTLFNVLVIFSCSMTRFEVDKEINLGTQYVGSNVSLQIQIKNISNETVNYVIISGNKSAPTHSMQFVAKDVSLILPQQEITAYFKFQILIAGRYQQNLTVQNTNNRFDKVNNMLIVT